MSHVAGRDIVLDVGVLCNSEDITLTLTVTTDFFNGMIYPKGLSKNSTCMTEYIQQEASRHHIPLTFHHAIQGIVQTVVKVAVSVSVQTRRHQHQPSYDYLTQQSLC